MTSDPTLRRTYQIEVEIDGLKSLRSSMAMQFGAAALELAVAAKGQSDRSSRALWDSLHELHRRYDCACRAVEAFEKHHMFSHVIEEVRNFMAEPERERRLQSRQDQDERTEERNVLKSILLELRYIRDKVDAPAPNGVDFVETRRALNAMQDGTYGQDNAQRP